MADSDPTKIPLTSMQQALSNAAAMPPGKRNKNHAGKPIGKQEDRTRVGKGAPGSWQKQPDRQPAVGGEIRNDRIDSFNREKAVRQSEEQIKEIDTLAEVLITVFSHCETILYFVNQVQLDSNDRHLEGLLNRISNMVNVIREDILSENGFTLERILSIKRAVKKLTLDIRLAMSTVDITPSDDPAKTIYKESLTAILDFATESEIRGTREIPSSLAKETSPLMKTAGVKVMRAPEMLPLGTKKVTADSSSPIITPVKSPAETAAEKLAAEKERNRKMFERASSGEEIKLDTLKAAGFTDGEAQDFLDVLELTK